MKFVFYYLVLFFYTTYSVRGSRDTHILCKEGGPASNVNSLLAAYEQEQSRLANCPNNYTITVTRSSVD